MAIATIATALNIHVPELRPAIMDRTLVIEHDGALRKILRRFFCSEGSGQARVQRSIVMSSRITLTVSEPRAFLQSPAIAKCFQLLAALLAISAGLAQAQTGPSQRVDQQPTASNLVSINQLQTPKKAQRALEKAREAFMHGRFDSALSEAEHALDLYPGCAMALNIQGAVNLSRTNFAQAGRDFQRAIDADPALGPAYLGLGMAYTSQGRFREALLSLDRAAAFLPRLVDGIFRSCAGSFGDE